MKTIVFRKFAFWALTAITFTLITGCNDPVSDYTPDPPPPPPPDPFELLYWSTLSMSKDWYDSNPQASEFIISNAGELAYLAKLVNTGKNFSGKIITLVNDIDLGGKEWVPIGYTGYVNGYDYDYSFNGIFDGNDKAIRGLYFRYINTADDGFYSAGLFGYVDSGTVKNLGIVDANVIGTGSGGGSIGIVAGQVGVGSVFNCYSSGTINGEGNVGGVVGVIGGGRIINCYSNSTVSSSRSFVGGVVGSMYNGSVTNCYATGTVEGRSYVGGVAGMIFDGSVVSNCYSAGTFNGNSIVGGIVGSVMEPSTAVGLGYAPGRNCTVSNCAALQLYSWSLLHDGRIIANTYNNATLSSNVAFSGMGGLGGGANTVDGADITAAEIRADGTIGGRFTAANGWTVENGKLPGIGAAVDMPEHLR